MFLSFSGVNTFASGNNHMLGLIVTSLFNFADSTPAKLNSFHATKSNEKLSMMLNN